MNIQEWDMLSMPDFPVIVNISRRRGGKSFLTRDIVRNYFVKKKKIKNILVISETGLFNEDYKWIDKAKITPNFNNDLINEIFERQKKLIEYDKKGDNELLIILDDVVNMEDSGRNNIKLLARLFTLSRHFQISIILNTQYIKSDIYPPIMRDNTDICIVFLQNNKDNKKLVKDTWLSTDDTDNGIVLLDTIPNEHHRALVIDITKTTNDYEEFCFYYTAQPINPQWRFKW